jgi:ribonuclease P/MRP protein subunit RPP40
MAILKLLDNVIDALDRGDYAATIFLDFSKAFDTVNHHILLQKMNHYGIRGTANKWFESYLSNRSQYCTFGGKKSEESTISCGLPQGSILRPLLFLLYINDLGTIFQNFSSILFADDSNLIASASTIEALERKINQDTPLLANWLQINRLSLNLKKTHVMVFGKKSKNQTRELSVSIEGTKLDIVKHTKFLGLILDNEISWKQHIIHISKKLAKSVGILKRARQYLNTSTLLQLYYSFLYPYLSYCCIIWGNTPQSTL